MCSINIHKLLNGKLFLASAYQYRPELIRFALAGREYKSCKLVRTKSLPFSLTPTISRSQTVDHCKCSSKCSSKSSKSSPSGKTEVMCSAKCYDSDPCHLSDRELALTKEREQVEELQEWLDANPKINGCKVYENLHFFLRTCKFDVERAKKKIKMFYQMRAERIEWFDNCNPMLPEIQELLKLGVFLPVDGVDDQRRKVVIIRTAAHDPKLHSQNNVFKASKMILDLLLKLEPDNCAPGIVAIMDMHGVQLGHALQMTPKLIKRSVESWTAYPCQPKLLEFTNTPRHVNIFLNTFRVFMTPKIRSRVVVRREGTMVNCKQLPRDLGGQGPSYKELAFKWKKLLEQNVDFYVEQGKYKSILK